MAVFETHANDQGFCCLCISGSLYPQVGGKGSSGGMSQEKKPHGYHGEHTQP